VTGECIHTPVDCDDGDPCTIDSCDPVTGQCQYDPNPACAEFCTYTIGYWGNHPEVTDPLVGSGIVITGSCGTVTLDVICVHEILPSQPQDCGGVESNSLVRQYIALRLAVIADFSGNDLGDLSLDDICIDFNSNAATINDLLAEAAEEIVCGNFDASLNEDLTAINEYFDECEDNIPCDDSPPAINRYEPSTLLKIPGQQYGLEVRPNPTNSVIWATFDLEESSEVELIIRDNSGKELKRLEAMGVIGQNEMRIDLQEFKNGIYFVILKTNLKNGYETQKFIILGKTN